LFQITLHQRRDIGRRFIYDGERALLLSATTATATSILIKARM
jgi:hypothetical protein